MHAHIDEDVQNSFARVLLVDAEANAFANNDAYNNDTSCTYIYTIYVYTYTLYTQIYNVLHSTLFIREHGLIRRCTRRNF